MLRPCESDGGGEADAAGALAAVPSPLQCDAAHANAALMSSRSEEAHDWG